MREPSNKAGAGVPLNAPVPVPPLSADNRYLHEKKMALDSHAEDIEKCFLFGTGQPRHFFYPLKFGRFERFVNWALRIFWPTPHGERFSEPMNGYKEHGTVGIQRYFARIGVR